MVPGGMGNRNVLERMVGRANRAAAAVFRTRTGRLTNPRPIVSFTFDDFPKSAVRGADILSSHGAAGAFYLCSCFSGCAVDGALYYDLDDVRYLIETNHEIGCHTASHVRVSQMRRDELAADLDRNAEFAREKFGLDLATFSFPFGDIGLRSKLLVQRRFVACRSSLPGINRGVADLGALRAERLYAQLIDPEALKKLFARAAQPGSWLIFYTHDVGERPSSFGCTPTLLEAAVRGAIAAGCEVLSIKSALGAISAARRS
jgi:peptidoglycan/xylan/chitin deacetylase (PgdA/CDA1 family)